MARIMLVALFAAALGALDAKAEIFYWKALSATYSDPTNWDVGSKGAGNSDSLVPGEEDEIFGTCDADWNLGGETRTIGKWDSVYNLEGKTDWGRYYINIANGTLNVKSRISHNDTIKVKSGASLIFPEGSLYVPSQNCGGAEMVDVEANARLEIKGTFSPYRITMSTLRYGETIIDPESFRIEPGSLQSNVVNIAGTNIFPNGLIWDGGATASSSLSINLKWSGRLLAAGLFDRNQKPGMFYLNVDGSGGVIESMGDVSFAGVDECRVASGMTFTANEGHTIDASNFQYYKHTEDDKGNLICSYKLGLGTLAIGADLPPKFQVNAGTIAVKAIRNDLAGMVFAGNSITVRWDVVGCRLDYIENEIELPKVTFKSGFDMSQLASGIVLFSSANETIRAAMKTDLEGKIPEGFELKEIGDSLLLMEAYANVFDSSKFNTLSDSAAWGELGVPVGEEIVVGGGGTVVFDSTTPIFSKILIMEGTTLKIEGGSESNPIIPPPLEIYYNSKVLCAEDSYVRLTNELECIALPTSFPVFEIATNAVVNAIAPEYATKGFTFKNMQLNYFGTIVLPDAAKLQTPCMTFGSADAGAIGYFGMNVDGGRLVVKNTVSGWQGNASLIRIMCPEEGGAVHPVGEFTWRNFVKEPETYGSGSSVILANSGYHIGVGNPENIKFTMNVSGTPIALNGETRISGGADIVCTGADSGLVKGETFVSYTLTQCVYIEGAACITLRDGARLSNSFCVGNKGRVYFSPTDTGHVTLVNDGGVTELYQVAGNSRAGIRLKDSCWDVGRLIPESTTAPESGWLGAEYSPVLSAFKSIELVGLVQIRATDGFNRPAWWNFEGYWDHDIQLVDMPVIGSGSILVTNTTVNNSMTLTVVNRGNVAAGTISAAPGTRSKVLFKNDANWAGTVVANGCSGLVNTDADTGEEKAAVVRFKNMQLDGDFPIRVWNTDVARTNDFIEFTGVITGKEGGFIGVPMDGRNPKAGDSYRIATYPAASEIPVNNVPRWRISSIPHDDESKVVLVLTYQPPGTTIVLR